MIPIPVNHESIDWATCEDELRELLRQEFLASQGFHRLGRAVGVLVLPEAAATADCLDLAVLIYLRCLPIPESEDERTADSFAFQVCLRLLESASPAERAAACRKLGQLALPEARGPLHRMASEDTLDSVRAVAEEALRTLDEPRHAASVLNGVGLRLIRSYLQSQVNLGETSTDSRGRAVFRAVSSDATCSLEVAQEQAQPKGPFVPRLLTPLCFSSVERAEGRLGPHRVQIDVHPDADGSHFTAVVRVDPPLLLAQEGLLLNLLACAGNHTWHAVESSRLLTEARFERLPEGTYTLIFAVAQGEASDRRYDRLVPKANALGSEPDEPQIVHPPDRRLMAVVEPDSNGCVLLTLETEASELADVPVRFSLASESGECVLKHGDGTGVWRATRHLKLPYHDDVGHRLVLKTR